MGFSEIQESLWLMSWYGIAAIGAVMLWSLFWKGLALYRSARRNDKGWFIALLFLNTLGILDIAYLYFCSEREDEEPIAVIEEVEVEEEQESGRAPVRRSRSSRFVVRKQD